MIPFLIGAAAVGLGAALLSDDKPQEEAVTQNKQYLTNDQVNRRLNRTGRRIKTVGGGEPTSHGNASSKVFNFVCSGNLKNDCQRLDSMIDSGTIGETNVIRAKVALERYYNVNVLEPGNGSFLRFTCCGDEDKDIEKVSNMIDCGTISNTNILRAIVECERYYGVNILDN